MRQAAGRESAAGEPDALKHASAVERVFGAQTMTRGAKIVHKIGVTRARMEIGMHNLVYTCAGNHAGKDGYHNVSAWGAKSAGTP